MNKKSASKPVSTGSGNLENDRQVFDVEQTAVEELLWFKSAIDGAPDCILVTDMAEQRFLYINQTACDLTGFSREEYMQQKPHVLTNRTREQTVEVYESVKAAGAAGLTMEPQIFSDKKGLRKAWWEMHHRAKQVNGRWILTTVSSDVTRRVLAEQAALRATRMYAALSASNEAIVHCQLADDLFQQICNSLVESGGFVSANILQADKAARTARIITNAGFHEKGHLELAIPVDSSHPKGNGLVGTAYRTDKPAVSDDFQSDPRTADWHEVAVRANIKAGAAIPILRNRNNIGILLLFADEKRAFNAETLQLLMQIAQNITLGLQKIEHETEREETERCIRHLATHDSLTGLPNRMLFSELLNTEILACLRSQRNFAVMFIDLDHFKQVNDTHGHATGDLLLKEVTQRLRMSLRASDLLARISGDEFVVLLREVKLPDDAIKVSDKMLAAIAKPMTILDNDCQISASIGISMFPMDGDNEITLMKHADKAMYAAKANGKNSCQFYSAQLDETPAN